MTKNIVRISAAALVGGIIWFGWGWLVHTVLISHSGINQLPNEAQVSEALRTGNPENGVYWLPWVDDSKMDDPIAMEAADQAVRKGPVAMVVYRRSMDAVMPPSMLVMEFLSGLAASFCVAILLSRLQWSATKSAGAFVIISVAYFFSCNISDWIWYGFPWGWVQSVLIEQTVGWAMVSGVIAAIVRNRQGALR